MSMRLFAGLMLSLAVAASCTEGPGKGADDTDTETDIDTQPGDDTDGDTDTNDTPDDTDIDTDNHTDTDLFDSDTDGLLDSGDSGSDSFGSGHTGIIPQPPDTGDETGGGGPGPGGDDTNQGCPALQVIDCEGVCANELLIGDGVCHDGVAFGQPNFDCEMHDNDGGDCGSDTDDMPCGDPLEIRDCDGHCYPQTWIGDGSCDDGTTFPHGSPDFQCELFEWDGQDCPTDTDLLP